MDSEFKGKTVLITGASSGIGRAAAVAFGAKQANVVVAARRVGPSEETARLVEEAGGRALFVKTDVTQVEEVAGMVDKAVGEFGRLDYAFNNAGILGTRALLHEYSEEDWDYYSDHLLKSVWRCMKYELQQMMAQGYGAIVNNSSVAGYRAGPGPGYTASKHGVIGLTRNAAKQYGAFGIRANVIAPGWIETEMTRGWAEDERGADLVRRQGIKRAGSPEEIAAMVLWLCSAGASFTTGSLMVVDGGLSI